MKSVAGFLGYASHVAVDHRLALGFSAAAVAGSFLGARLVSVVHPDRLRRGFAVFVLVMAALMLFRERATFAGFDPRLVMVALVAAGGVLLVLQHRRRRRDTVGRRILR
jgi:hypothetical protein